MSAGDYDPLELLEPIELAELWKVTPETIRRWIASGELESVQLGNRRRVPRAAAEDYQRQHLSGKAPCQA
jgi:excisionase family DNA binding protein